MGLDMFAYRTSIKPESATDFSINGDDTTEIQYWRKHPNLHGWMESLYYRKGGKEEIFNCVAVELTEEDLTELESAIQKGDLPSTRGFFFGESEGNEEEILEDLEFVETAKKAISEGDHVFYSSWW